MSRKPGSVGQILGQILKGNDLKATDIVRSSGIPKSSISKILSNDMAITIETDILLTKALGLSQGYLLNIQRSMEWYNIKNNKRFQDKLKNVKPLLNVIPN